MKVRIVPVITNSTYNIWEKIAEVVLQYTRGP